MLYFQTIGVEMPKLNFPLLGNWIEKVATDHNRIVGIITYKFCNDEYILEANNRFLCHDYYTDVITFDYSGRGKIAGDVLISLDTVASNARDYNQTFDQELLRVIIHGVLHLCGINDKGPGEREIMEQHENAALSLYQQLTMEFNKQ